MNTILIKIYCLSFIFVSMYLSAQIKNIPVSGEKFVSINFPARIESSKISIPELVNMETVDDNLYIQYLDETGENTKEGNLLIKTIDGMYYSFLISYKKNPEILNYFYTTFEALKRTSVSSSPKTVTIQELGKKENSLTSSTDLGSTYEKVAEKIITDKGFVKIRNITKMKNVELIYKGSYINNDKLYFLLQINNFSNIPYEVEDYKFLLMHNGEETKMAEGSSVITPIYSYKKLTTVPAKSENLIVFTFNRFTIDESKNFVISLLEKKGDRHLLYKINSTQISKTKKIEL